VKEARNQATREARHLVSPERTRNKNKSREAMASAEQMVFMSERGKKPSDRRVEICDFQAKDLVSP